MFEGGELDEEADESKGGGDMESEAVKRVFGEESELPVYKRKWSTRNYNLCLNNLTRSYFTAFNFPIEFKRCI